MGSNKQSPEKGKENYGGDLEVTPQTGKALEDAVKPMIGNRSLKKIVRGIKRAGKAND